MGRVRAGQPVTVTLDAYPGIAMPGKIETLSPGASQKQGSTVYGSTISFTPVEGVVSRTGMAANVDITAQRKDNVLLLPNRAFETVGTRQYVTLKEGDATRKVEVETGLSNTTDTEIVSGVKEGQLVVTIDLFARIRAWLCNGWAPWQADPHPHQPVLLWATAPGQSPKLFFRLPDIGNAQLFAATIANMEKPAFRCTQPGFREVASNLIELGGIHRFRCECNGKSHF